MSSSMSDPDGKRPGIQLDPHVAHVLSVLPDAQFFTDEQQPKTYESVKEYTARLEQLRAVALASPLSQMLPHDLLPVDAWTYSCLSQSESAQSPGRLVQDIMQPTSACAGIAKITLRAVIRVHRDAPSQVYKGSLQTASGDNQDVCVKVYQQSLDYLRDSSYFREHYWCGTVHKVAIEAWAYRELASLQGVFIPRSLGLYKICLPNGEPSISHVLEYFPGSPLSEWRVEAVEKRLGCTKYQMVEYLLEQIHAMHVLGIVHEHLSRKNIVLLERPLGADPRSALAIVGFSRARPFNGKNAGTDGTRMLQLLYDWAYCNRDGIKEWFEARASASPRPPWLAMFSGKGEKSVFVAWNKDCRLREIIEDDIENYGPGRLIHYRA